MMTTPPAGLTPPDRHSKDRGRLAGPSDVVWDSECFTLAEKAALFALWRRADRDGWCWPKLGEVAAKMGGSNVKTARAAIHALEVKGLLFIILNGRETSYYKLNVEAIEAYCALPKPTRIGRLKPDTCAKPTETGIPSIPILVGQGSQKREAKATKTGRQKVTQEGLSEKTFQEDFSEDDAPAPARTGGPDNAEPGPETGTGTASLPTTTSKTVRSTPRQPRRRNDVQPALITETPVEIGARLLADTAFMADVQADFPAVDLTYQGKKWLAYIEQTPPKNYKNGFRNWCEKSIVFAKRDAEREAARSTSPPYRNGTGPPLREAQQPVGELVFNIRNRPRPAGEGGPSP